MEGMYEKSQSGAEDRPGTLGSVLNSSPGSALYQDRDVPLTKLFSFLEMFSSPVKW